MPTAPVAASSRQARRDHARAPPQGRLRRLRDQCSTAARAVARHPAARGRRTSRCGADTRARRPSGSLRGRGTGLSEPVPGRLLAADALARSSPRTSVRRRRSAAVRTHPCGVRLGQSHRADARRPCAQRGLRRLAGACPRASTAMRSNASSTSTTPAHRCALSASRFSALARGEDVPEGGYRGDYVHELAQEIDGAASSTPASSGARPSG